MPAKASLYRGHGPLLQKNVPHRGEKQSPSYPKT